MKYLKVLLILILSIQEIHSQSVSITGFKNISQKRYNWCWAASIQMIYNYQNHYITPPLEQCNIVQDYFLPYKISESFPYPFRIPLSDFRCCENLCSNGNITSANFDLSISGKKTGELFVKMFDLIGYNSKIHNKILSFPNIQSLINAKSPFILSGISYRNVSILNHAIVCSGYYLGSTKKLLKINDPWQVCVGCDYYINYDCLLCKDLNIGKNVISIYDIHPKPDSNIIISSAENVTLTKCNKNESQNEIMNVSNNLKNEVIKIIKEFLNDGDTLFLKEVGLNNFKFQDFNNFNQIEVKVFSRKNKLNNNKFNTIFNPNIFIPQRKFIFNIKNGDQISTISFIGNNDFCFESISKCSWLQNLPPNQVYIENELSQTPNEYSIITCEPFQYGFYEIKWNSDKYLIPINNYKELDLSNTTAYKYKEILKILSKDVYNKLNKLII